MEIIIFVLILAGLLMYIGYMKDDIYKDATIKMKFTSASSYNFIIIYHKYGMPKSKTIQVSNVTYNRLEVGDIITYKN